MAGTATQRRVTTPQNSDQRDTTSNVNKLIDDVERLRVALGRAQGFLTSAPGLRIGTSSAAAIKYDEFTAVVRGGAITVSAGEEAFTATTHDIADPDSDPRESWYVLSVNASGTITTTKGTTAAEDAAVKPVAPVDEVIVGYVKIQHDGTAIFDATTDLLSASHLTVTYEDAPVEAAANLTAGKIQDEGGTDI